MPNGTDERREAQNASAGGGKTPQKKASAPEKSAAQTSAAKSRKPENSGKSASAKAKTPLWLKILQALYLFIEGFGGYFRRQAAETARFYIGFLIEFFSGLPEFFAYMRAKRKKKRESGRKKRAAARALSKKERKANKKREKEEKRHTKARKKEEKDAEREKKENENRRADERKQIQKDREAQIRRAQRKKFRRALPIVALASVLGALCLLALVEGGTVAKLHFDARQKSLTVVSVAGKTKSTHTVPASYADIGGPRFEMTAFAQANDLHVFGNRNGMYYSFPSGQTLYFEDGTNRVMIGDHAVSLENAVIFGSGNKVYVPLELLTRYAEGLGVSYSKEESRVTLTRLKDVTQSTAQNTVYIPITLKTEALSEEPHPEVIG